MLNQIYCRIVSRNEKNSGMGYYEEGFTSH